jgi:hypothetical protein
MIPNMGEIIATRMRAEGDMCSVVFPKRVAVEVMVVKPVFFFYINT